MGNIIAAMGNGRPRSLAAHPVDLALEPLEAMSLWPAESPLACVISAKAATPEAARWSRWSILAAPSGVVRCWADDRGLGIRSEWVPLRAGGACPTALGNEPLADLDAVLSATAVATAETSGGVPPFVGGWIVSLSYDLGRHIEPRAVAQRTDGPPAAVDRPWPLIEMWRCSGALVHDGNAGRWWAVGDRSAIPTLDQGTPRTRSARFRAGAPRSGTGRVAYEESVERALEFIRAGDIFQANLAHRLSAKFAGSPRALARRLLARSGAWYGAYLESPGRDGLERVVCSASPELFLEADGATRRVVTRPIKGTIRAGDGPEALMGSEKDRAELTMITDLMRNDLGRVCEYGSVKVDQARAAERHGAPPGARAETGVYHTVATVSGTVRPELTVRGLLRASFPPGSVTGAPKVRAMQVIDGLEPVRRGPYCGSIGFVSDCGSSCWNVAIRTAALSLEPGSTAREARGVMDFSVGAGIVAESRPDREWRETLHKAGVLRATITRPRRAGARP